MRFQLEMHAPLYDRYAPGFLDAKMGHEVRVTDYLGDSKVGMIVSYEIIREGRACIVTLEVDGDLVSDPPLDSALAYSIGHNSTGHGKFASSGKRYTGQSSYNR